MNTESNTITSNQELLAPFRQGKSEFHIGHFGNPDGDRMTDEQSYHWADVVLTQAEKSQMIDLIGTDIVLEEYWDKGYREVDEELEEMDELFQNWQDNWMEHIKDRGDVKEFLEERLPALTEELDNLVEWLTLSGTDSAGSFHELRDSYSNLSDEDLLEIIHLDASASELLGKYIAIVIEEDSTFQVGDYFYHNCFNYPTRQNYGIGSVGYDRATRKKVPIFDGEGMPEFPKWLREQFDRTGLDYSQPEDEIDAYFTNY